MSTRRTLLRSAATAGLAAPLLTGCVTAGGGNPTSAATGDKSDRNPLGVPATSPLEVVIFKGGYGDDYAKAAEAAYHTRYPGAKIDHKGIQKVGEALQPRFVPNTPPDVVDNSGAGRLDVATLADSKQLTDLAGLLGAPSWDDPKVAVRDTLIPGVVDDGTFGGGCVALNYTYTVWGLWYSKPLFVR